MDVRILMEVLEIFPIMWQGLTYGKPYTTIKMEKRSHVVLSIFGFSARILTSIGFKLNRFYAMLYRCFSATIW